MTLKLIEFNGLIKFLTVEKKLNWNSQMVGMKIKLQLNAYKHCVKKNEIAR